MQIYESNPNPATLNLTDHTPEPIDLRHPLNPSPSIILTCVERRENFHRTHIAVHREFHPKSDFQRLAANRNNPRKHGLYAANFELSGDLKRQAEQDAIRAAACFDDPAFKTLAAERAWLRGRKYYFFLLLVAFFKKYDAAPNRFSARSGNLLRRCLRPHGTPSLLPRSCTASTPQESNSTRTGASGSPDPLPPRCHGA